MKKLFFVLWCTIPLAVKAQNFTVTNLRCQLQVRPLGLDIARPALSWELQSIQKNVLQTAYRIVVSTDSLALANNENISWDSKRISANTSIQVSYNGSVLEPATRYYWKVMSWDNKGNQSPWSAISSWQMGLFTQHDWKKAQWITNAILPDANKIYPAAHGNGDKSWGKRPNTLPLLRKQFTVSKPIKQATAFISGLGQFEMMLNGKKVGDHFLDPGWTRYNKQALYVSFDISNYLQPGQNAVGVMLGNGFYYIPGERYRKMTGAYDYPKMISRIAIEYTDGTKEDIISDDSWKTTASPIIFSSIYGGEDYDANLEQAGWDKPGFNDAQWKPVLVTTGHDLQSQVSTPIKIMQAFTPVQQTKISDTLWVYDMGQNMSGIPAIAVKGNKGDTIRIRPAELLTDKGLANQKHTGSPVFYQYILKGEGEESWQPRFHYYGYRYVQVELVKNTASTSLPVVTTVKGLHSRNSAGRVGSFHSSSELFNKTFDLILWAINSNMQSVFTDCPHREKLGWQEEVHLVGNSIQYNYNISPLSQKIFRDIQVAQSTKGLVPSTVPEFTEMHFADGYFRDSPEWGSNAIIFPWYSYLWYGDKKALEDNYATMRRYVRYLQSKDSSGLLMWGLSDWYDLGPQRPGFSQLTPMGLTATAYYYYDLCIMEKVANLLGEKYDAEEFKGEAARIKKAFNKAYFHPAKMQYGSGSQTSNAMPLYMGLVEDKNRQAVLKNLIADIKKNDNKVTAGDIGYRYLLKVLSDAGRNDVIFDMNSRSDVPGYGYQLAQGATALTESWQALPTVSNNHLMLGHLMEWFYESLAGIKQAPNSVGYKNIIIQPQVVGNVTAAQASYHSAYGVIESAWKKEGRQFVLNVTIPANTTAQIILPSNTKINKPVNIGSGEHEFTVMLK